MSQSSSKPNYNKHFPRSFLLNYGEALQNLPDEKILCRLKDWNCEWLSRPNIAITEMASTIKDNIDNIRRYKGTVFTDQFVDQIENYVEPILQFLRRLDNKDRSDTNPPETEDVLDVLRAINDNQQVEDLFVDAFNATGPVLMMSIHVLVCNCLLHNPDAFAAHSARSPGTEAFRTDPSPTAMMQYLINAILMRRRAVQRTINIWDSTIYNNPQQGEPQDGEQRRSRPRRRPDDSRGDISDASGRTSRGGRSSCSAYSSPRCRLLPSTPSSTSSESRRCSNISLRSSEDTTPSRRFAANGRQRQTASPSWHIAQQHQRQEEDDDEDDDSGDDENQPLSQAISTPDNCRSNKKGKRVVQWVESCNNQDQQYGEEPEVNADDPQRKTKKQKRSRQEIPDTVPAESNKKKKRATESVQVETPSSKNNKKNKKKKPASFLQDLAADQDAIYNKLGKSNSN